MKSRVGQVVRQRYLCMPADGSPRHTFQPVLRPQHALHGPGMCESCETPTRPGHGPHGGDGFEFLVREIAHALIRTGQAQSYRRVGEELRARAGKHVVRFYGRGHTAGGKLRAKGGISRQANTVLNYIDAFAPLVLAPHAIDKLPPILLLDAIPFRAREKTAAEKRRAKLMFPASSKPPRSGTGRKPVKMRRKAKVRERGRILVAFGQDAPYAKPYPVLLRFMGGGDEVSWTDFLRSLPPGTPDWIVSDRDGGIINAVSRVWPAGPVWYPSHYHLLENATSAAKEDGFPDGHLVFEELEAMLLDPIAAWPSLVSWASHGKKGDLARWLTDNAGLVQSLPAIRQNHSRHPRSAGAAESFIRTIKNSLGDRVRYFRNAERVDRLLALMALVQRNLADEREFAEILRAWFLAHDGGRSAADWAGVRDPKGMSSMLELIAETELRAVAAKAARSNVQKSKRYRAKRQNYAAARAAQGLAPAPVGIPRASRAAPGSVAGKHVSDFRWLVAEWHPTKNGTLQPKDVPAGSGQKIWWKCDRGSDHEWESQVRIRTIKGSACPFCAHKAVARSESLAVTHPDIAAEWHPTRNGTKTPFDYTYGTHTEVWFQCPRYRTHVYRTRISSRTVMLSGCPSCALAAGKGARPRGRKAVPAQVIDLPTTGDAASSVGSA